MRRSTILTATYDQINAIADKKFSLSDQEARILISLVTDVFRQTMLAANHPERKVQALITKFRDAGRRSAPWQAASQRVPGRPQDGLDGNRINRWLMDPSHKFYASEPDATLVEVKYYLQALSMDNAPPLPSDTFQQSFVWLLGHQVEPGAYQDPIQLIPIDLLGFVAEARTIQSGHLVPLDRGGRHKPDNTYLMLSRSNQIQGNLTLAELIQVMDKIVTQHKALGRFIEASTDNSDQLQPRLEDQLPDHGQSELL